MKLPALVVALSAAALAGCAGAPAASTPAVTVTATVTAEAAPKATPKAIPTPSPVPTSGNYGADLAAVGVVPDNVASFGAFMKKQMCDSDLTKKTAVGSFSHSVEQMGKPGTEATGTGPAVVRLTVAYFCPARSLAAENQLKTLGYVP